MQLPADVPPFAKPEPLLHIVEVDLSQLDTIKRLNRAIFHEDRVINTFEREDLMILLAYVDEEPVGFKIGYRESRETFYSAKGGVLSAYRRRGISRRLLVEMMDRIRAKGYECLAYDTFPNMHPGMTVMGLAENFRITRADYNSTYKDYRLRFEKKL
ncbi:MAG: GNAT family N-acetyltransferase [Rhodothermales bacterium]